MTRPLVVVASPYFGDVDRNTRYACRALLDSLKRAELPVASHLLYPQVLQDNDPAERAYGLRLGLDLVRCAEWVAAYTDYGVSSGMLAEIELANQLGTLVYYREIGA